MASDALIESIAGLRLDGGTKGLPLGSESIPLGDVGKQGWSLPHGDITLPALILRDDRMRNNLLVMKRFAEHHGVSLSPHGKSTFSPQLFRDQIDIGGAWGITVANVQQAVLAAGAGADNILIANEVIGPAAVRELVQLKHAHRDKSFISLVDSKGAADQLQRHGADLLDEGERFVVLMEVGFPGGRAGVRDLDKAQDLIRYLMERKHVFDFAGVECYEGLVSRPTREETLAEINRLLDFSVEAYRAAESAGAFADRGETILTAGGSVYFDRVVERYGTAQLPPSVRVILRGGCSLTYDHGVYKRQLEAMAERGGLDMPEGRLDPAKTFTPALELWANVLSLQDDGVAILNMGIRDLPHDLGLPVPIRHYRGDEMLRDLEAEGSPYTITAANDQHCYMAYPAGTDIAVGDAIATGISHPCTAFDKWDIVYRVDEDLNVIGAVKTFF